TITGCLGCPSQTFGAVMNLTASSVTGTLSTSGGNTSQAFSGSFSITTTPNTNCGVSGNCLSSVGTFQDTVFGVTQGTSLTMSVSQPPDALVFSSGIIGTLAEGRAMSLAFSSVNPIVGSTGAPPNGVLNAFTASLAFTFSAENPTPQ